MDPICFYEGPYAALSNFSAHKVTYRGREYMTSEHAYQAAKYTSDEMHDHIASAPSAFLARELGQSKVDKAPDWDNEKKAVMKDIMRCKLEQHEDVYQLLLSTGTNPILKNHPLDSYWGTGADGKGKNVMGRIWEELRDEILQSQLIK